MRDTLRHHADFKLKVHLDPTQVRAWYRACLISITPPALHEAIDCIDPAEHPVYALDKVAEQ